MYVTSPMVPLPMTIECPFMVRNIFYNSYYRQDLPESIVFTNGPILGFFAPQGRHVAPISVKFGREERSYMPNFTLIGSGVWVYGPKT